MLKSQMLMESKDISFVKTPQGQWQAIYDRYPMMQNWEDSSVVKLANTISLQIESDDTTYTISMDDTSVIEVTQSDGAVVQYSAEQLEGSDELLQSVEELVVLVDDGSFIVMQSPDLGQGSVSYGHDTAAVAVEDGLGQELDEVLSLLNQAIDTAEMVETPIVPEIPEPPEIPADGEPCAPNIQTNVTENVAETVNIIFIVDISGSMGYNSGVDGLSVLELANQAWTNLLSNYENINATLVSSFSHDRSFDSDDVNANNSGWLTGDSNDQIIDDTLDYLQGLDPSGWTNYGQGLATAMEAYGRRKKTGIFVLNDNLSWKKQLKPSGGVED